MLDLFASIPQLESALDYHLERQNVLATNIAHVDTPGYVPRDIARTDPSGFGQVLSVTMERTNAGHIAAVSTGMPEGEVFLDPSPSATGRDLNSVSLDREAAKASANQIRYDVVSQLVSSELSGLQYVANDGH